MDWSIRWQMECWGLLPRMNCSIRWRMDYWGSLPRMSSKPKTQQVLGGTFLPSTTYIFFYFFSSDFFPDSDIWTCVGWFLGGQESSNPKTQQVWEGSFFPSTTLLKKKFSISQRFSHFWGATFTSKTILGSKRGKTQFFFLEFFFESPSFQRA